MSAVAFLPEKYKILSTAEDAKIKSFSSYFTLISVFKSKAAFGRKNENRMYQFWGGSKHLFRLKVTKKVWNFFCESWPTEFGFLWSENNVKENV